MTYKRGNEYDLRIIDWKLRTKRGNENDLQEREWIWLAYYWLKIKN